MPVKNTFVFTELNTEDPDKAKKFYKSLFAWKLSDQEMGEDVYTMIDTGVRTSGGGMQKKGEGPTAWLPYVEVADVKRTIAKAQKLGAQVLVPFQPIGEMGSIGIFVDPTGAKMGVWARAKKKAKRSARK